MKTAHRYDFGYKKKETLTITFSFLSYIFYKKKWVAFCAAGSRG